MLFFMIAVTSFLFFFRRVDKLLQALSICAPLALLWAGAMMPGLDDVLFVLFPPRKRLTRADKRGVRWNREVR